MEVGMEVVEMTMLLLLMPLSMMMRMAVVVVVGTLEVGLAALEEGQGYVACVHRLRRRWRRERLRERDDDEAKGHRCRQRRR